mmetsp:Transcript_32519/g.81519  ORF Transcript_32519/g.81519 Transcript_32519/m.81519 type:complete len:453 (-) Transcript_32519:772-2130(-)
MDASKALHDDGTATKMTRLQSSVFATASLAIVCVTDHHPRLLFCLVGTSGLRDTIPLTSELVAHLVLLAVLVVHSANQKIVTDVIQVATVLQPGTSRTDVIGGTLATSLDQHNHLLKIFAIPLVERSQQLKTVAFLIDRNLDARAIRRRSLEGILSWVKATSWQFITMRRRKLELRAIGGLQGVGERVECQITSKCECSGDLRAGHKGVCLFVAIVTAGKVAVVRGDNAVRFTILDIFALPLTDAGTARVGEHLSTAGLESLQNTITLDGGTNLLRTGGHSETALHLDTLGGGLGHQVGRAAQILVRAVGAASDQTVTQLARPVVLLENSAELANRSGQIGSERTVEMRLKSRQIDLHHFVVLSTFISAQVLGKLTSCISNVLAVGCCQVIIHTAIERESTSGSSNLGTHVTDSTHASARHAIYTRTKVLDDCTGTTLHCENTSHLQDDILG